MSENALGSVVLLRNAAAHAGHIKQELAAIIQSSGALQADWFPARLSGPAVKVLQGSLPAEYQELREPSVPDLSYALGQGVVTEVIGEDGVAPGEQQAPPKTDDGGTPLPHAAPARDLGRGRGGVLQSYPIFPNMQSDDDASLQSEASHLQLRLSRHRSQLRPVRTHNWRHAAGQQHAEHAEQPQQHDSIAAWQPWQKYSGSHGPTQQPHTRQASPVFHPSRPFRGVREAERPVSPDLSSMYNKGFPKSPRSAPRSPRAKRKASPVGPVQEPPAWDNSSKGHSRGGAGGSGGSSRGPLPQQRESLLELKQRVMARLQQANEARYLNRSKRQGSSSAAGRGKQRYSQQENAFTTSNFEAAERVPYETLLRQRRSSSSVAPPQSKGRPSWSISESQPSPSAWHETLDFRSLQNSPHRPALPQSRASHPEEEDWPDLTQLKWEGGATGVVRVPQNMPLHGKFRQNPAKASANLDKQVFTKSTNGRQQKMNGALADHSLPVSVSLADRPRWGSPSAVPSGPQGRAISRSLSALPSGLQGRAVPRSTSLATGQQLHSSHESSRPMTQPLRTHISLDSLMVSPKPDADQQDQLLAQPLIRDQPDHRQSIQHDGSTGPTWHRDDRMRRHGSSIMSNGRVNDRGGDGGADRVPSEGVPSQPPPPQQPVLHEREQPPAQNSDQEEAAARAMPNFASPTRSSEAKAQQRSLHAFPSRRRGSRQSAGSIMTEANPLLLRKPSEGSQQAARWGGVGTEGGQTPGSGGHTPLGSTTPLTSTFRLADITLQHATSHHASQASSAPQSPHHQQQQQQQERGSGGGSMSPGGGSASPGSSPHAQVGPPVPTTGGSAEKAAELDTDERSPGLLADLNDASAGSGRGQSQSREQEAQSRDQEAQASSESEQSHCGTEGEGTPSIAMGPEEGAGGGGGAASMLAALQRLDAQPDASSELQGESQTEGSMHSGEAIQEAPHTQQQALLADLGQSEDERPSMHSSSTEEHAAATAVGAESREQAESDREEASSSPSAASAGSPADPSLVTSQAVASSSGSPVTPIGTGSFLSLVGRVWGLDQPPDMQSPNKTKYSRSDSRGAGVRISDHPVGKLLLQACPEVGSMSGADLVTALTRGSEMRKAWEGGSGGSNRLVQCLVSQGQACLVYGHGWLRKSVQHPIDRIHIPATAWQPAQAITVDTVKGAIDLEPATQKEYAIWVLGLIAALTNAQDPQSRQDVPGSEMLWCSAAFVMSN